MNYDNLKLDNQLCHRLYTVSNAMTRAYRPMLQELDITYPQYIVLMALWEEDKISVLSLVEKTSLDAGSLSLMLTKMLEKNLISIAKNKLDRRQKIISLSAKGLKLKEKAITIPERMWCSLESLSYEDALKLVELLDKMSCDFKKE
ncbi:MarR family transcriptional regulator [Halobacteriovorax sp. JY17]|uniref:MarR family winged helix-turn-helix transcriptional regulator n=1 Tax=Halobacteriovorax sp. JY17 TaxID=2014617 RepID=UPI000C519AA3|nr:MarR family transcriptional regulator [Halobacteriovorax sp. JY17]PIK15627.1 MAG: MarR family transcriptional regulator [Halobacteriovorax sp. JY17]